MKLGKVQNIVLNSIIKLGAVVLGFLTTRWLINFLPEKSLESYYLILAFNNIILATINLGIPTLIQKYYTNITDEKKLSEVWTTISALRIFTYFLGIVIILFTYPLSQTVNSLNYIIIIFTAQFILVADQNYRSVADTKHNSWQVALTDFLGKISVVAGIYTFTIWLTDYKADALSLFAWVSVVSYAIVFAIDFVWQYKNTKLGRFNFELLKENIPTLTYLSLSAFIVSIYLYTDKIFLKLFGYNEFLINSYSNSYKLFEVATIVPSITAPILSSFIKNKIDRNEHSKVSKYFKEKLNLKSDSLSTIVEWCFYCFTAGLVYFIISIPMAKLGFYLIDPSNKYSLSNDVFPILAANLALLSPVLLLGNLIIFFDHEKQEFLNQIIVCIFGLSFYLVLIPIYGIFGAAWATLIAYLVDLIVKIIITFRILKNKKL